MTEFVMQCLKLVPFRAKNIFEPCLSNEILAPLRVFFENFLTSTHLLSPPPPPHPTPPGYSHLYLMLGQQHIIYFNY